VNKVYVTAYSSISALGVGNEETYNSLKENKRNLYVPSMSEKFKLPYFRVDKVDSDKDNHTKCAELALELMKHIEDKWIKFSSIPVYIATSTGGIKETEEIYIELVKNSGKYPLSEKFFFYDIYETIKQKYKDKIGNVCSTFTSACSSAGHSLLHATRFIKHGIIDKALIIGVDSLSLTTLIGFNALKVVSLTGTKPLTVTRDGMSLGEGGGILLLESNPDSTPIAEITGVYSNTDGYHATAPNPAGTQQKECILEVLKQGNINPENVDYISAHGTGTPLNDEIEMKAINEIFKKTTVTSLKGFVGHTLGSSAVTELGIIFEMLKNNKIFVPHNIGESMNPELIPVKSIEKKVKYFMKNSFGFGGNNVSILVNNMM
jgi:3-oxoacyl-[acyl-carrier-protein] synthase I